MDDPIELPELPEEFPEELNWERFHHALQMNMPFYVTPREFGLLIAAYTTESFDLFEYEGPLDAICCGSQETVEANVRDALESWLEEAQMVLEKELGIPGDDALCLEFTNLEGLVPIMMAIALKPAAVLGSRL